MSWNTLNIIEKQETLKPDESLKIQPDPDVIIEVKEICASGQWKLQRTIQITPGKDRTIDITNKAESRLDNLTMEVFNDSYLTLTNKSGKSGVYGFKAVKRSQ